VQPARPLLLDPALQQPVAGLAAHLAREHEEDLDFAGGVEERGIGDAESLWDEGEEGAEVGDWVGRVLWVDMLV
jgi:hypothetical protein